LGTKAAITDHFSDFRVDYLEIPATNYADAEPRYTFRVEEQENLWEYYFVLFQRLRIYANLPRTVEELMRTDETLPRNPVLAKFFRIAKLCESAGYGFDKMPQWKKQTGNKVLFETTIDKTKFTFMLDTAAKRIENEKSGMGSGMIGPKSGTIEKENGIESGTKIKTVDNILDLISKDNTISITQLSIATKITRSTIQKHMDNLKAKGIIHRDGTGKGGKWVIIKP
jgi:predicted HTH transcriptional regulator